MITANEQEVSKVLNELLDACDELERGHELIVSTAVRAFGLSVIERLIWEREQR